MTVPARITWAVGLIDPGPADHLLEVGCGPGVAASLICPRLTTGRLLAVDRSAVAVRRTAARNAAHVATGRLEVRAAALETLVVEPAVDVAFAIDVNVFWTRPAGPAPAAMLRALRPGGRLLVLYGAGGPTAADRVTGPVAAALTAAGLTAVRTVAGDGGFGVTALRPPPAAA